MPGLKLRAELGGDGAGFFAMMNRADRTARHFGKEAIAPLKHLIAEAFTIGAITHFIHKTTEVGEKLVNMSRRTGVGIEALQELGFAAKKNGAEMETLIGFIEKLNTARIDPKKLGSFAKLGISAGDLGSLKAEDLIQKISESLRGRSPQETVGALRDVGGRGAGALMAMLREDLKETAEEAHRLGVIMRAEDAAALKFLSEEFKFLSDVLVAKLAPAVAFVLEEIHKGIVKIQSAGTFWGDFIERVKNIDVSGESDWREAVKGIFKGFNRAFTASGATAANEEDDAMEQFTQRFANFLKTFGQTGPEPQFEEVSPAEKKAPRGREAQLVTDALSGIGNFLGRNPGLINDIAGQHLAVARSHLQVARETLSAVRGLQTSRPSVDDLEVPEE